MTIAFVLGNGLSRAGIPLNNLKQLGTVYGCNALYRDFVPDVLVATDRPIADQIQNSGYALKHRFYTRRPLEGLGANVLEKDYFGFSSGPNAVGLAAKDKNIKVYLLGFDMGPDQNNQFNNVYAGTEFYKNPGDKPTYSGNWIKQLCRIVRDFPQTKFVRVCGSTTAKITEFESLANFDHMDIGTFLDRINNQKDF